MEDQMNESSDFELSDSDGAEDAALGLEPTHHRPSTSGAGKLANEKMSAAAAKIQSDEVAQEHQEHLKSERATAEPNETTRRSRVQHTSELQHHEDDEDDEDEDEDEHHHDKIPAANTERRLERTPSGSSISFFSTVLAPSKKIQRSQATLRAVAKTKKRPTSVSRQVPAASIRDNSPSRTQHNTSNSTSVQNVTRQGLAKAASRQKRPISNVTSRIPRGGTSGGGGGGGGGGKGKGKGSVGVGSNSTSSMPRRLSKSRNNSNSNMNMNNELFQTARERAEKLLRSNMNAVSVDPELQVSDTDAQLGIEELLDEWLIAIERVMSDDKLRTIDIFRRFDKDKDSRLSIKEFTEGLGMLGVHFSPPNVSTLFAFFDPNTDGFVELKDFARGLQYRHKKHDPKGDAPLMLTSNPSQSPHKNCKCLTLPNNATHKTTVVLGLTSTKGEGLGMSKKGGGLQESRQGLGMDDLTPVKTTITHGVVNVATTDPRTIRRPSSAKRTPHYQFVISVKGEFETLRPSNHQTFKDRVIAEIIRTSDGEITKTDVDNVDIVQVGDKTKAVVLFNNTISRTQALSVHSKLNDAPICFSVAGVDFSQTAISLPEPETVVLPSPSRANANTNTINTTQVAESPVLGTLNPALSQSIGKLQSKLDFLADEISVQKQFEGFTQKLDEINHRVVQQQQQKQQQHEDNDVDAESSVKPSASTMTAPPPPTHTRVATMYDVGDNGRQLQEQLERELRSQKELAYTEARLVREMAEKEARVIKTGADAEAKLLRDAAEQDARMLADAAKRSSDAQLSTARREVDQLQFKADQTLSRIAQEQEEHKITITTHEEEHKRKVNNARSELQSITEQIGAAKTRLTEEQSRTLVAERNQMQAQVDELHDALVQDRRKLDDEIHEARTQLKGEYETLEQTKLEEIEALHKTSSEAQQQALVELQQEQADLAAKKREFEEGMADKRKTFTRKMDQLRAEVENDLVIKQKLCEDQIKNQRDVDREHRQSEASLTKQQEEYVKARNKQSEDALQERLKQQETLAKAALEAELVAMRSMHLKEIEQQQAAADKLIEQNRDFAEQDITALKTATDHELQAKKAATEREVASKVSTSEQNILSKQLAAEQEILAKKMEMEQEVTLLEQQIQTDMNASDDGAMIYRLHTNVKTAKKQVDEALRKKREVELERDELETELSELQQKCSDLSSRLELSETQQFELEAKLEETNGECEAREQDQRVVQVALEKLRREKGDVEVRFAASEAALSSAKSKNASADTELSETRRKGATMADKLRAQEERLDELELSLHAATQRETLLLEAEESLKDELRHLSNDLQRVRNEALVSNDKAQKISQALEEVSKARDELNYEVLDAKAECEKLTNEREHSQTCLEETRAQLTATVEEHKKNEREHKREMNDVRNKNEELTKKEAMLKAEITKAQSTPSISPQALLEMQNSSDSRARAELAEIKTELRLLNIDVEQKKTDLFTLQAKYSDSEKALAAANSVGDQRHRAIANLKQELTDSQHTTEDLKAAIVIRDKAAATSSAGVSKSLTDIRNQLGLEKKALEDRLKKQHSQSRDLQTQVYALEEQRTKDEAVQKQLLQDVADMRNKMLSAQAAQSVAQEEVKRIREESRRKIEEFEQKLVGSSANVAAVESQLKDAWKEIDQKEAELESVKLEVKENQPALEDLVTTRNQLNVVMGMLEKTSTSKDELYSKLNDGYKENVMLRSDLVRVTTTKQTVEDKLNESKRVLQDAEQQKRGYQGLWSSEAGKHASVRADYSTLQGSVNDVMRENSTTGIKIDELAHANDGLRHTVARSTHTLAAADNRIANAEDRMNRELFDLRSSAAGDRTRLRQVEQSAADATRVYNLEIQREKTRSKELKARQAAREREHQKLVDAYMTEVGSQRRELDSLQSHPLRTSSLRQ